MSSPAATLPSAPDAETGPVRVTVRDPFVGRELGARYRVEECLGEGGIGRVYRAVHLKLGRSVAVKVLQEGYLHNETLRQRFEREARALAALSHPNIVTITDFGIDDEVPYLAMELVEGQELTWLMQHGGLPTYRALHLMRQILRSVAYAHQKGIVHRDLKPANVIVRTLADGTEHVEVLDFGLARFVVHADGDEALTRVGVVVGTPAYMPPEQASGDVVDERADVYAAGAMLFEMLTGRRPFDTEDNTERIKLQLTEGPPAIAAVQSGFDSPELEALVERAMSPKAKDRYADAMAMLDAVNALPPELFRGPTGALRIPEAQTTGKAVPADTPPTPKLAWALVLLVVLAIPTAIAVGALVFFSSEEPPSAWSDAGDRVSPPLRSAELPAAEHDALDPWSFEVPAPLTEIRQRVVNGEMDDGDPRSLRQYMRVHPRDPRGPLLLGHGYFGRMWYSDALPFYREAYVLDDAVRGDPTLLDNLLTLAVGASHADEAIDFLERAYGPEALPAIDRRIEAVEDAPERRALGRLREHLAAP